MISHHLVSHLLREYEQAQNLLGHSILKFANRNTQGFQNVQATLTIKKLFQNKEMVSNNSSKSCRHFSIVNKFSSCLSQKVPFSVLPPSLTVPKKLLNTRQPPALIEKSFTWRVLLLQS